MDKVVIFGTGGFAREVHEIIEVIDERRAFVEKSPAFIGFLDGDVAMHGKEVHGAVVLGGLDWLKENRDVGVVVAVGSPATKRKIIQQIKKIDGIKFPKVIDPRAIVGKRIEIGEGCIICGNAVLTSDIFIKDFVTLNISCTVGHDSIIHDYVTVAPGSLISGNVIIGEGSDIGTGSSIIQGKNIGSWSIIGAGAVVVKDIPDNVTSVGNPAKVIKEREMHWQV